MSDFKIDINTNPIPPEILIPVDFANPSGSSGGGGATEPQMNEIITTQTDELTAKMGETSNNEIAAISNSNESLENNLDNNFETWTLTLISALTNKLEELVVLAEHSLDMQTQIRDTEIANGIMLTNIYNKATEIDGHIQAMQLSVNIIVANTNRIP